MMRLSKNTEVVHNKRLDIYDQSMEQRKEIMNLDEKIKNLKAANEQMKTLNIHTL
jgi:hypothetical protein